MSSKKRCHDPDQPKRKSHTTSVPLRSKAGTTDSKKASKPTEEKKDPSAIKKAKDAEAKAKKAKREKTKKEAEKAASVASSKQFKPIKSLQQPFTITFKSRNPLNKPWRKGRGLKTSYMSGRPGSSSRNNPGYFMQIIDIFTMGEYYEMYTTMYFGDIDKRSEGCQLLVDSGMSVL